VLIAGPNPTVDRLIDLDRFAPGHIHRARSVQSEIGGGGVNAAQTIKELGGSAKLITLLPGNDEAGLARTLRAAGISVRWVSCVGQVRVATILREDQGRLSVLTEPGAHLDIRDWEAFQRVVFEELRGHDLLLCTGSVPPGVPCDGYARFARQARHNGSRCVVDAGGDTLGATVEAGEAIVVPNLSEAEGLIHGGRSEQVDPNDAPDRARAAADELLGSGAHIVVVTAGSAGVAFGTSGPRGRTGWIDAPQVRAANPIGAGDAFAAGLCRRLEEGADIKTAAQFGVAVAAARISSPNGRLDHQQLDHFRTGAERDPPTQHVGP
jgi:1-phosphofructokinase